MIENRQDISFNKDTKFNNTICKFLDKIQETMDENCEFSRGEKISISKFSKMFSNNMSTILMSGRKTEQIVSICKNIFSLSSKMFFNDNELKKVKLSITSSDCFLTIDEDDSEDLYSLHDLLQIIMAIIYSCVDESIGITDQFIRIMKFVDNSESEDSVSHNLSLGVLIGYAREHKDFVSSIFLAQFLQI